MGLDIEGQKRLRDALRAQLVRQSQKSFEAYYRLMTGFTPPRHIKVMSKVAQSLEEDKIDRAMIFAPPRHAKRLADDTPILTANRGWTTHGELRIGDKVWHPSGKPVRVQNVSEPGQSDLMVHFSNGEKIQCDSQHLWTVWDRNYSSRDRYRGHKTWETVDTAELVRRGVLLSGKAGRRGARYRWQMPEFMGLRGSHLETKMGPYSLGAWLGDGSSRAARLTCSASDIDNVVAGFGAEGYVESKRYVHKTTGVHTASFSCGKSGQGVKSKLRRHLEEQGVWNNKHIPEHWFTASQPQRIQLLAGLMDTDGHCEENTGRCRIVTASKHLAQGIFDLCASLGFRPYLSSQMPDGSTDAYGICSKSEVFTVGFQPHEPIPCRLERKRTKRQALRRAVTIKRIERVNPKSCRCIRVDAADGLYLAGRSLIPTHNTTMFSDLLPSWIIGRHPKSPLMSVVHTQRFAGKIGRKVRNRLLQPEWPFSDVTLASDSTAREQWATPQGGEYNAFGAIGGNQHGNAAEWLFMDDLIKGRKNALSEHMREEAWETYKTDLLSRLEGRAKQVMVFTRWNEDDPAGRILPEGFDGKTGWYKDRETGEKWFVLSLPALAEHENDACGRDKGEWLWPERFGEEFMRPKQRRGGWIWSSLYQQRPSPEEGMMFQKDHITRYDPDSIDLTSMQIYLASDYAVTAEAGASDPDYTVHMVWGVDPELNIFLLDMWRGRTTPDVWVREWIRLAKKWKPLRAFEEGGQIIKSVGPFLKPIMLKEKVFVNRVQLNSSVNKEQRAQSLLGMASMGKMYLPRRDKIRPQFLANLDAFEKELMQFPTGRHDDCVDTGTLFARGLDRVVAGRKPKKSHSRPSETAGSPHGDTINDLWSRHEEEQRRREKDQW